MEGEVDFIKVDNEYKDGESSEFIYSFFNYFFFKKKKMRKHSC